MTNAKRNVITLGFLAMAAGTIYWLSRPKAASAPVSAPAGAVAPAPNNPVHEMAALEATLKESPKHLPILMRLAELEHQTGKPKEAIRHLKEAIAVEPKNAEAHLELGRILFETNDFEGAVKATNTVIQIDPKNVDALYNLGAMYGNAEQDGLAREYWTRAVAAGPNTDSGQKAKIGLTKLAPAGATSSKMPANHPPVK